MKSEKSDFTQGSILKKLVLFMLPILGALVLQAAYGAVDLLVVGHFGSTSGLSAVSTGSQVLNLVTFVVTQFAMGITVLIARYLGEKRPQYIGQVIGGAVVVFAHPTVYKSMPLVRQLAKEGMIDGIEVEHPRNSPEDKAECAALCKQYGLIHTGGTDFHGANHKVPHPVGTCTTEEDQIARILELAHQRRGIDV